MYILGLFDLFSQAGLCCRCVLYPLAIRIAEGLLDMSALPITGLSVCLVVIILSRPLPPSTELLDFRVDTLAFLVEP